MAETLPVQEPVAHYDFQKRKLKWAVNVVITSAPVSVKIEPMPLYAAPLQRQWVGLTDEEIETTLSQLWCDINIMKFMTCDRPQQETVVFILSRAIEAKLKEKNHG